MCFYEQSTAEDAHNYVLSLQQRKVLHLVLFILFQELIVSNKHMTYTAISLMAMTGDAVSVSLKVMIIGLCRRTFSRFGRVSRVNVHDR